LSLINKKVINFILLKTSKTLLIYSLVQYYNEALTQLNLLNSKKETSIDEDCLNYLISLLQKSSFAESKNDNFDNNVDPSELAYLSLLSKRHGEQEISDNTTEFTKKFPFNKIYD
jgi:hypothetical protein